MELVVPEHGLILELRSCDYIVGSGSWHNRAGSGRLDATVPNGVQFDDIHKAFVFEAGGDVISAPLATNPQVLREVTFAIWVKVHTPFVNLGWLLCQYPDYGWSRALTLNDYRLGHVSVTTSQYWNSEIGPAPVNEWLHVVGIWFDDGSATVYLNGMRGATTVARNAKSADSSKELLIIGGRSPHDSAHNPAVMVSDVCIFDRALEAKEVRLLHSLGRPSAHPRVLTEIDLNAARHLHDAASMAKTKAPSDPDREEPIWCDKTKLFWCKTKVNAYDVPDGGEWQRDFRLALERAKPAVTGRVLCRNTSESDTPPSRGRVLARAPSDPDKRTDRAAHTEALMRTKNPAGVQVRVLGRTLALFRFEGRVFVVDAACPHQGASLCEGEIGDIEDMVDGRRFYVRCKVHKFQFDLCSGAVIDSSLVTCPPLRTYRARVSPDSAVVEVGFESLASDYFALDGEDF
mmetsp:Transcript_89668/g.141572  ORF Transcript_89668/g.141572 Transcript_89668/m.141572 type:complete len:460 (+) Transcript_89668:56-1435(+)|eukprot:CAMPEP_0169101648 /NCGR_PEP_ID=MMETSP1015-20121227/21745_1 /TAXON_ID=342587 /ORGANISM="Karlodinium micrum, Strain CCMP2283" /LENGTH=459 /DNA_ID=CAMNT_0009162695 /DNA_START=55 /DNA_END=1434 /DNA_ORIENTATION=+